MKNDSKMKSEFIFELGTTTITCAMGGAIFGDYFGSTGAVIGGVAGGLFGLLVGGRELVRQTNAGDSTRK